MTAIKDGHIGWREASGLIITFLSTKVLLVFPRMMVKLGNSAGWMIPVIATVVALLGFGLITALMKRFPGKNIVEVSEAVAGKFFGVVFSFCFFGYFLFMTIVVLREFAETVISTALPQTPISVVMAIFLVAVVYATYLGVEAIARGNWLLFPFMFIGFATILAGVLPYFHSDALFPVFGPGPVPIIGYGLLKSSLFGELLLLGVIYPYLREKERISRIGILSIFIAGAAMTITVVVLLGVFGSIGADIGAIHPMFQLARLISYGRFVQRIEAIFLFVWIFAGLIDISLSLYASTVIMAGMLKLPVFRPLIFPLALLVYSLSFLPPDYVMAVKLDTEVLRTYGWSIAFVLPGFLLLLAKVRGYNGDQPGNGEKTNNGKSSSQGSGADDNQTARET